MRNPRRWTLVVATVVVGLAITAFSPSYLDIQRAAEADRFRFLIDQDGDDRVAVAALLDFAFAVLYAATVYVLFGAHRRFRIGVWLVAAGAVFDEVENSFVLYGALRSDSLTDGDVEWMKRFGALKSIALILGAIALIAGEVRHRLAKR